MRTLVLLAGVALASGGSCSDHVSFQPNLSPPADCSHSLDCIQIAFTGFRGENADLRINGQLVFQGPLETQDWSTESSGRAEFVSANLYSIRLKIDQKVVFEQPVRQSNVRTIYIQPQAPYVRLTDHPAPLLD